MSILAGLSLHFSAANARTAAALCGPCRGPALPVLQCPQERPLRRRLAQGRPGGLRSSESSEPEGDPAGGPYPQPRDVAPALDSAGAGGPFAASRAHVRGRPQGLDPRRASTGQRQRSADAPARDPDHDLAAARVRRHASAERIRGDPGRPGDGDVDRVRGIRQVSSSPAEGMVEAADAAGARAPGGAHAGPEYGAAGPGQAVLGTSGLWSLADPAASALETYIAPGEGAPGRGGAPGPRVSCTIVPVSQAGGSARRRVLRTTGERAALLLQTVADVEACKPSRSLGGAIC